MLCNENEKIENLKFTNFDNAAWKIFPMGGHVLENKFAKIVFLCIYLMLEQE